MPWIKIDTFKCNDTWMLVDLPPGQNVIGCKWVYKKKANADGSVDKYKAQLETGDNLLSI